MKASDPRLTMAEHVLVKPSAPVAEVWFNRPEKRNAFVSGDTYGPIQGAFTALGEMEDVKVVLFRGVGETFSAGGDVSTLGHMYYDNGTPPEPGEPRARLTQRRHLRVDEEIYKAWEAIAHCNKVVIAEGKGHVLGVGLDWFLAADIVICAEGTLLGYPPGRMVGYSGVNPLYWMLRMGPALHAEMTLMGRYVLAEEACERGLVNRVVPRGDLETTVEAAAEAVCCIPADGLAIGKLSRRIAYEALGSRTSGLQSVMGHSMAVQQRLGEEEWNLVANRRDLGAKGVWRDRDKRFKAALDRYNGES